jgi:hypothetical protein
MWGQPFEAAAGLLPGVRRYSEDTVAARQKAGRQP